jgi:uncharacterized damage-inducible protein DinB
MLTTNGNARTDGQEFVEVSRIFLKDDFLPKLLSSLEAMSDDDVWWRPNEESNSVGNLILHLHGNMKEWIVNGIGGGSFVRDRDAEFARRDRVAKAELAAAIRAVVEEVDAVLSGLPSGDLLNRFAVQDYSTSRLEAIYHVVEHFSYHLGQILYISKLRIGKDSRS